MPKTKGGHHRSGRRDAPYENKQRHRNDGNNDRRRHRRRDDDLEPCSSTLKHIGSANIGPEQAKVRMTRVKATLREVLFHCSGQSEDEIPENVTRIIVDSSVTEIPDEAFSNKRRLRTIVSPSTVTAIGESAFFNCGSLVNVALNECVTRIPCGAFQGCHSLTTISL